MNLKDEAKAYEPKQTLNIADLERVSVDMEIFDSEEKTDQQTGKKWSYKYIVVDEQKYRVPGIVLGDMKGILEKFPDTTHFIVTKKGTGKATRYQVMPAGPKKGK